MCALNIVESFCRHTNCAIVRNRECESNVFWVRANPRLGVV